MTIKMLEEYTRAVRTGPPVIACGSIFHYSAPRARVFFGNFSVPVMPEDVPTRPLRMDTFLKYAESVHPRPPSLFFGRVSPLAGKAHAAVDGQLVRTVRVMTARAKGKLVDDYETVRATHRSPNFVVIDNTDRLRPLNPRENCLLLGMPCDYYEPSNANATQTTYHIGSTFDVRSLKWILGPSLAGFPQVSDPTT